jgi:hypothetical protein
MFFFLIPGVFFLIFGDKESYFSHQNMYKKTWLLAFPLILVSAVASSYFIYHKLIYLPKKIAEDSRYSDILKNDSYAFDTSSNYAENIQFYLEHTIPRIFDVINLHGYPSLWLVVVGLIVLPITITIYKSVVTTNQEKLKKYRDPVLIMSTVCGYFFLASAPIISQGNHSTYRVILVMSAIIFVILVWAVLQIFALVKADTRSMKTILSCSLLAFLMISTHITVVGTVRSESQEIDYVKSKVRQFLKTGKPLHRIHLITTDGRFNLNGEPCDGEFFCSSARNESHFMWAIKAVVVEETGWQRNTTWVLVRDDKGRTGGMLNLPIKNYYSPVVISTTSPHEACN